MELASPNPGLSNQQRNELRSNLGELSEELLPVFEAAVRTYTMVLAPGERGRRQAERYVGVAKRIVGASDQLLDSLRKAKRVIDADPDFVPGIANRYQAMLRAVEVCGADWRRLLPALRRLARRTPGRKAGDPAKRIRLCAWVGLRLDEAGISLSSIPTGTWGQVYTLLCEAARVPTRIDVGRDLRRALAYLKPRGAEMYALERKERLQSIFEMMAPVTRLGPPPPITPDAAPYESVAQQQGRQIDDPVRGPAAGNPPQISRGKKPPIVR